MLVPVAARPEVEVLVLGPLAVRHGDRVVVPPSARTRVAVGVLALAVGRTVPGADLVDALWPESGPDRHRSALSVVVHRARRWLADAGGDAVGIDSTATGYALTGPVDAARFTGLVADAEMQAPGTRADLLAEALDLWRADEPLAGTALGPVLEAPAEALRQARLVAATRYGAALLRLGRAEGAVAALRPLADRHPLDERLHAVLIEALAAAGRQADALDRYERLRARLADELGVGPGAELAAALLRVLRREPAPAETPPVGTPSAVPAQLPPDPAGFTGRAEQLAELDRLRGAVGGSLVISAVDGIGGVGKTALAVRWARRHAVDFPDGQLYVNLRGHAHADPVDPGEALGGFLRALGVPADRVPTEVAEAAALYRSTLAGRRVLVLLDNARDAEQVRPLLPASAGCVALVTSRDRLDGLVAHEGAGRLTIDVLDPDEALTLLRTALGEARVAAEPDAARELVALCGRLPLALRVTAALLATVPGRRLADQAAALREDRWHELAVPGDPRSSVQAAFDLSYRQLSPADQRLFRLLGHAPAWTSGYRPRPPSPARRYW